MVPWRAPVSDRSGTSAFSHTTIRSKRAWAGRQSKRRWPVAWLIVPSADVTEEGVDRQRPLRLTCYLDASTPGGSSASLAVLLGALDPAFDITVMGTSESMVRWVAAARPGAKMRLLSPVRSKLDVRAIGEHVRAVRELRPDILHVNLDNPWTSQYGLLAGVLTRTPMVSVLHLPTPPWNRRQQWLVRPVARRVKAYVCVSHDSARFAESMLHMKPGWARVIHNGMPVPRTFPPSAPSSPPGTLRIGAVGRLAPQKGLDVLIEAMRSLPDCRLVLVGDGPDRAKLEELVRARSLGDRVEFAGWVDAPWTASWAFDVLAMPSVNEGFPLVIVEAMLAGIPVVASTVGGIPEIVVPGSTGLLVPPQDPGAFVDALRAIAGDPQLRADMAARCRSVALEQFTAEAMAARFEALYRDVRDLPA
jgi:glycosyltransferase involved in cell wall biosynthesis